MSQEPLTERLGIPRALIWGFIGLAIFMIGDGVETNILEPFLSSEHGFTVSRAGLLVTLYGIAVAIAAFFAAALSDLWGPRRVMALGAGVWVVFELAFLLLALTSSSTTLIFLSYGLRGFGYPLFAYGFLVWITAVSPAEKLGTATGWFYVAFSAGLPTLGALTATVSMAWFNLSFYETLWVSLVLVIIGAACALIGVKERIGRKALVENPEDVSETLGASFKLLIKDRRARFVVYIRTINSIPTYAMAVFFPAYFTERLEWPLAWFLILTTVIYAVNLPFNPFYGRIGDKFGWSKTTVWAGAVSCGVTLALVYFCRNRPAGWPRLCPDLGLRRTLRCLPGRFRATFPHRCLPQPRAPRCRHGCLQLGRRWRSSSRSCTRCHLLPTRWRNRADLYLPRAFRRRRIHGAQPARYPARL